MQNPSDREDRAWRSFQEAYRAQMDGDYDGAVKLYQESIAIRPTAEAHTFLGWTYHFQGKIEEAIAECRRAINIDPDFGNPYNDIGSYLIGLERYDEAIPWLERAITAKRYDPRHFSYFNLGRVYLAKGLINRARDLFQQALEIEPRYTPARQGHRKNPTNGQLGGIGVTVRQSLPVLSARVARLSLPSI